LEFLNRHYEKVILAILLLIFILLLANLTSNVVAVDDSPLDKPNMHRVDKERVSNDDWKAMDRDGRLKNADSTWSPHFEDGYLVDLTFPVVAARCPFCDRLVRLEYFSGEPCPTPDCGRTLPARKPPWTRPRPGAPQIAVEELYDDDNDGFSFRYEVQNNTNPADPASHPPLWQRLYVTGVNRVELGGKLTVVNAPKDEPDSRWYIQIDIPEKDRQGNILRDSTGAIRYRRPMLWLDSTVDIDGTKFKVVEITPRYAEDSAEASAAATNESTARLQAGDLEIEMQVNQPAYYPEQKIFMSDLGSNEEYRVDVGDVITMGNNLVGQAQYKVTATDTDKLQVTLIDIQNNQTVIGTEAIVPKEMRVRKREALPGMIGGAGMSEQPGTAMPYQPGATMPYQPGALQPTVPRTY